MKKITQSLFPNYCILCYQKSVDYCALCASCLHDLPWNFSACKICACTIPNGTIFCGSCLATPPVFTNTLALFRYQQPISKWISQLKFRHNLFYARLFSSLFIQQLPLCYNNPIFIEQSLPEVVIPIPLHKKRLSRRGFNQALEIAKPIARKLNITLSKTNYYRQKNTKPQSSLPANERSENLRNAFSTRKVIQAKHVAIIDDVFTTGETITAFSKLLKKNGVERIDIWCCARA